MENVVSTVRHPLPEAEVREKFTAILADILVLNPEDIQPASRLVADLDADSIAFLELTYRLRQDFGLDIPDAKADEETLRMPLVDGVDRLEKQLGGTTLFEFMKEESVRPGGDDPEVRQRMLHLFHDTMKEPGFAHQLRAAVSDAREDANASRAVGHLVLELRRTPELAAALQDVLARDVDLAGQVAVLESEAVQESLQAGPVPSRDLFSLWREVGGSSRARERMAYIRVKQLAALMSTQVPKGYQPDAPVTSLQLRDLFSFITVDTYVRYILFLSARQARRGPAGAQAMPGEPKGRATADA
jgi:acyl carrier protein